MGLDPADSSQDDALSHYLDDAEAYVKDACNVETLDSVGLISLQLAVMVHAWSRRGIEGETSYSEGGVSRTFADAVPADIADRIGLLRKPRW